MIKRGDDEDFANYRLALCYLEQNKDEQAKFHLKIAAELDHEKAKTNKGLKVVANVIEKVYETGKKVKQGFKENMKIMFDKILPKWNYRVIPERKNKEVI